MGRWATVTITDAIIAPGKADGTSWDGTVRSERRAAGTR